MSSKKVLSRAEQNIVVTEKGCELAVDKVYDWLTEGGYCPEDEDTRIDTAVEYVTQVVIDLPDGFGPHPSIEAEAEDLATRAKAELAPGVFSPGFVLHRIFTHPVIIDSIEAGGSFFSGMPTYEPAYKKQPKKHFKGFSKTVGKK